MTHDAIDGVVIGKHPLVSRLMKGIYNQRPPQPRYSSTWDVKVVLDHIKSWGYTRGLPLKKLTLKLAMLLALANASRCSELDALEIQRMTWSAEGVTFALATLTKTLKPGKSKTLFYPMLGANREACPVTSLKEYLMRTKDVRKGNGLFLSYVKPHGPVKPFVDWSSDSMFYYRPVIQKQNISLTQSFVQK